MLYDCSRAIERWCKNIKNISKIATGQGDDSITGCLLDYRYFI